MELRLQLIAFALLAQVSLALRRRVTVQKGHTLDLSCPITDPHKTNVDWKNPEGYVMFFNNNKALKDKRYMINKLSQSEFAISISNVTFSDGGNYTCSQYGDRTVERKVEVTVLGHPKMSVTKHDGQTVIKCTAEGNHPPPLISWKLDHGPEILGHSQVDHDGKKYVSVDMLRVQTLESRVTVKCLVRHPALHSQALMNFVKIGQDAAKSHRTTTTSSPTAQPEVFQTTPGWSRHGRTTLYLTTRDANRPSSESSTSAGHTSPPSSSSQSETAATGFPANPDTSTGSPLSTAGWTPVAETTEEVVSYNNTDRNGTGSVNDRIQTGSEGSSALLVFLVTCLIFALLVVVIFFTIKLRKAHITWKRENEDSNPSEESSKSKSSQEERNAQGQRRRGHLNTAFTQYVTEERPAVTSVINAGAAAAAAGTGSTNREQSSQPRPLSRAEVIKETEL